MRRLLNCIVSLFFAGILSGCILYTWPGNEETVYVPFNSDQLFRVLSYGIPQWYVDGILIAGESEQTFLYLPAAPGQQQTIKAVTRIGGREFSREWVVNVLPCSGSTWDGDFTITTSDHVRLLRGHQTINGSLIVDTALPPDNAEDLYAASLNGLECLQTINGSLAIQNNIDLADLSGLRFLSHVGGDLTIVNNGQLLTLDALKALRHIGGSLDISSNFALWNINGLKDIPGDLGDLSIKYNLLLTEVVLPRISGISSSLTIRSNPLLAAIDLSGLQSIGQRFEISYTFINTGLAERVNFNFQSLISVGEDLIFNDNFKDYLNNDSVSLWIDLSSLRSIGGDLSINQNHILDYLGDDDRGGFNAFYQIDGHVGGNLSIQNNRDLHQCRADEFQTLPFLVIEGESDVYPNNLSDSNACETDL